MKETDPFDRDGALAETMKTKPKPWTKQAKTSQNNSKPNEEQDKQRPQANTIDKTMNTQANTIDETMNKQAKTIYKPMNKQANIMNKQAKTIDKTMKTSQTINKSMNTPRWLNKHPVGYTSFPIGGQAPGVVSFKKGPRLLNKHPAG